MSRDASRSSRPTPQSSGGPSHHLSDSKHETHEEGGVGERIYELDPAILERAEISETHSLHFDSRGHPILQAKNRPAGRSRDSSSKTRSQTKNSMEGARSREVLEESEHDLNDALRGLEVEFKKGHLLSPEIELYIDRIAASRHGKQLPDAMSALRAIDSRAGPSRRLLALTLSASCAWGVNSLLGCIIGVESAVVCVTSTQTNALLSNISNPINNPSAREKEAGQRDRANLVSLNEVARVQSELLVPLANFATSTEALVLRIQDVQSKMTKVAPSLSSVASRRSVGAVESITEAGTYRCPYGVLNLTDTGGSFNGIGKEAQIMSDLSSCSRKLPTLIRLMNMRLEDLFRFAEINTRDYELLIRGSPEEKAKAFNLMANTSEPAYYQWTRIQ